MNFQEEENDFFKLAEEESAERERKEQKKLEKAEKRAEKRALKLKKKEEKRHKKLGLSDDVDAESTESKEGAADEVSSNEEEASADAVTTVDTVTIAEEDTSTENGTATEEVKAKEEATSKEEVIYSNEATSQEVSSKEETSSDKETASKEESAFEEEVASQGDESPARDLAASASENTEKKSLESEKDSEDDDKKSRRRKRKRGEKYRDPNLNIVQELLSLIVYIGVVILICFIIMNFVGGRVQVEGPSMQDTLYTGDNLWVDRVSYKFSDPKRFDVVVFPVADGSYYIKRVIGLPGEKVQILPDGTILINDKALDEHYGKESIWDPGIAAQPFYLGEDEYFVLGDNRNDSHDSRASDIGNISKDDIFGKAVFRLSPIEKFGKID